MRTEVVMPQMGESVAEGTVTQWLKAVGDRVAREEPLFEITTDKVDAEIPSPTDGVLVEIKVQPGETVEVNAIVAVIDTDAAAGTVAETSESPADSAADEAVVQAPEGPDAQEPGSAPQAEDSPETRSAAPTNGVGSVDELRRTRSTPLVRRIAREHGIADISAIRGTGRSGRVTKKDILGFIAAGKHKQAGRQLRDVPDLPPVTLGPRDRIELMSPQRQAIARHMVASRATSSHAQTIHELDFSAVAKARAALKAEFEAKHTRLTYTAFLVKAVGEALSDHPLMNTSVDGDHIVYRGEINIGVAVDTGSSLIVPVVRNVDELSLLGVARAVNDLSERARAKRLQPSEVQGGTFTVSNPGIFGSEFGIPIINQPQAAILVSGAIKKRVVVDQATDAIMVRPTSILCLSFDHRVIDGATADRFMQRLRSLIEGWAH